MDRIFGPTHAKIIRQRLFEIAGAPSIEALRTLPALDIRSGLTQDQVVIEVGRYGIVLEVSVERPPGSVRDVQEVTVIEIQTLSHE